MEIEFGLTKEGINTQYAPLVALSVLYQQNQYLSILQQIPNLAKKRDFSLADKLMQILLSMLAGCETLSEVNIKLRSEIGLAQVWGWGCIADQSTLSRSLDQLSLKQIDALRETSTQIWRSHSQTYGHNWHGYLWLEYDLSGLPCSARAEASQKGYFSAKKTPPDASWPEPARSNTGKPSGQMSFQAITIPCTHFGQRS